MDNFKIDDRVAFARREDECEFLFRSCGPFWHLCTPGTAQEILFSQPEDYRVGITSPAIALDEKVAEYAIAVMSNHLHDVLAGLRDDCLAFFWRRRKRIENYFRYALGRHVDLRGFEPELIPIESLAALRKEIVYVNRNGYVSHPAYTPFSYPWSSGMYYFNPAAKQLARPYGTLPYESRRRLTRSRIQELPDDYEVKDGMIHIPSFVRIDEGEAFFRDAHQYFSMLSRNAEAYSEVAKRLGDKVFLTDDELFSAVCSLAVREYGQLRPTALAPNDKIVVAVKMKQQYNASNGQIRRMLGLDDRIVKELFP